MDTAFDEFPDPNATTFAKGFYRFIHLLDDLVDHDKERTADDVALTLFAFVDQVANNPFFQRHKQSLLPIVYAAGRAWASSERLRKSDDIQNKIAAEVLKSQYQDLFHHIAFLSGGIEFAVQWEEKHRSYVFG